MSLIRGLPEIGLKAAKKKPFYSAVDETLANLKRNKGTGIEFLTEVMKTKGVKPAEIADRKLEQAFKGKGKMTKEEAQQILAENPPPQVEDRHLREISDYERDKMLEEKLETSGYDYMGEVPAKKLRQWNDEIDQDLEKYGDYKTAGGQNYREILLKLPQAFTNKEASRIMAIEADLRRGEIPENQMQELIALKNKQLTAQPDYRTSHWNEDPNVLAHMRVQDRKGPNGEKILHVEEIQSDWHQAGRKKGYGPKLEEQYRAYYTTPDGQQVDIGFGKTPAEVERMTQAAGWDTMPVKIETEKTVRQIGEGVPDAPFKKNWHELAMKRLLNYAAENGYDSIAISPGAEQFRRYGSERIDWKKGDDGWTVGAKEQSGGEYGGQNIEEIARERGVLLERGGDPVKTKEDLHRIISIVMRRDNSKEQINKLTDRVWDRMQTEAEGTSLPRKEGMEGFYDKMLTDYLNSYGKDYGARVEMGSIPVSTRDPRDTSWGGGMRGDHPFITVQDLNEPFDGMVELMRRNADTGEETLVGRMTRPESERLMAEELAKLDTYNQVKLHNFPITPEMRESIKTKGLPLYQQVGIPTAGVGAASQMLEPQEEPEYSKGGSIAKMAALAKLKQMRGEMAPRAEAVKNIIARDQNSYLRDVAPNSLTNPEIEAEIKRMAAKAKASGQQEGVLPLAERDANLVRFLKESQIKDKLYRGQRRAPKADRFITTQSRATPSFTDNPDVANVYSQQLGWDIAHGPGSTSVPVHVQMKKPFDIRNLGEHVTLEEFLNKLDHDLTVPRSQDKIGYEDLADILGTLDHHVFKGNAKHNIDATDNRGTFRVRSFEQLADEVNEAGRKKNISRILDELLPDATIDTYALADSPEVVKQLKKLGYDSMIHKDVFDAGMPYYKGDPSKIGEGYDAEHIIDAYRPFEQSKIKSAIGNRGTYDINEPDITKATGGAIAKIAKKAIPVVRAPEIIKPSGLTELKRIVEKEKGGYGARRVERAADEVPNLEKMYTLDALKERFTGDNAKALMTMSPADFEKFATELQGKTSVGPKAAESAKQGEISKYTVPTNEYVKHLERIAMFDSVPYLNLAKEEVGLPLLPYVSGHEGRHRSRALAGKGEKRNLVGVTPTMDLREGLPRRSQEEFIEAMKKELELSGGLVLPQSEPMMGGRPPIILPDVYAKGGSVKPQVKKSVSGKVKMSDNRDAMFMELSNKKLKRK